VCEHYKTVGLLNVNHYNDIDNIDDRYRKYDMPWGGFSIEPRDWNFIKGIILEEGIKTVLEFGAGLSSLLMAEMAEVLSYEADKEWAEEIRGKANGNLTIGMWDGKNLVKVKKHDLAFIDGPRGGESRENSYRIASKFCNRIITHDSRRTADVVWQNKYLQKNFDMVSHNGHHVNSCKYWKRKAEVPA